MATETPKEALTTDDGLPTATSVLQQDTERQIVACVEGSKAKTFLLVDQHVKFLEEMLERPLPAAFVSLDASRPWLIYWSLHSLAILDQDDIIERFKPKVISTLASCQCDRGGFSGGPQQIPHLATTYAAVCALAYTGPEGYAIVDRKKMYDFILSMKQPNGSFTMHDSGESDVRATYCALAVASLLNIYTPRLKDRVDEYVFFCQNYEGGFCAEAVPLYDESYPNTPTVMDANPIGESHGGYAFCALAAHQLFETYGMMGYGIRFENCLRWASNMQGSYAEAGGFRGRTNKLVDGCYSWWCGALFNMLGSMSCFDQDLFDRKMLAHYIIHVAQSSDGPGLRDKPGKRADAYHTCYNLSGLSSAQHDVQINWSKRVYISDGYKTIKNDIISDPDETPERAQIRMQETYCVLQSWMETCNSNSKYPIVPGSEVAVVHPVFNIRLKDTRKMLDYFFQQKCALFR